MKKVIGWYGFQRIITSVINIGNHLDVGINGGLFWRHVSSTWMMVGVSCMVRASGISETTVFYRNYVPMGIKLIISKVNMVKGVLSFISSIGQL